MKFRDLPIGTKFLDDIEINKLGYSFLIKTSKTEYSYTDIFGVLSAEWVTDDDVYPILEWEDQL